MARLRYMKPVGGLPDPRGLLSLSISNNNRIRRFRRQLELWMEVNIVLTSGTALLYLPKLLTMPAATPAGIIQ